jgi:hypothetical protein
MFSIYDSSLVRSAQKSPLYAQFVAAHYAARRMGCQSACEAILRAAVLAGEGDMVGARANMAEARELCREARIGHLISSAISGRTVADASALEVAV